MRKIGKKRIKSYFESHGYFNADKGYVFTPTQLAQKMVAEMPNGLFQSSISTFLNGDCTASWTLLVSVVKRLKDNGHSDENIKSRVWGFCTSQHHVQLIKLYTGLTHIYCCDFLTIDSWPDNYKNMKFDTIIGNPPYNAPKQKKEGSEKLGGGTTLWDKFVINSFSHLNNGGYVCLVHPIGWRSFTGDYKLVADTYNNNNLIYVSMNNAIKGLKDFGAGTAYDIVICQKSKYEKTTTLVDYDGKTGVFDISDWRCIPSGEIDKIQSLISNDNNQMVEVLYSAAAYESRKPHIQHEKTKAFKHPVVHSVNVKGVPSFIYSSKKDRGMFGISKIIFGRRECGLFLDLDGKYACSQDTRAIVDTKENLIKIEQCMKTDKFVSLMRYLSWNSTAADKYDKNALKLFRKDFWKEFL